MRSMVLAHVNELASLLYSLESSFNYSLRTSYECHDSTVGSFARINVQNLYSA
jgi:hypothetical protein